MDENLFKLTYISSKNILENFFPDEIIFFEDIWDDFNLKARRHLSQEWKGSSVFYAPSDQYSYGKISLAIVQSIFDYLLPFYQKGIKDGTEDLENLVRSNLSKITNLPDVKLRELSEAAEKILNAELSMNNINYARMKSAKKTDSNIITLGLYESNKGYLVLKGKKRKIKEDRFFPWILVLFAARIFRGRGDVDKKNELLMFDSGQSMLDLRKDFKYRIGSNSEGTELIKKSEIHTGKVYLNLNPEYLRIDESVCNYDFPERQKYEDDIKKIYNSWINEKEYYSKLKMKVPPKVINDIIKRRHIGNPGDFQENLERMERYVSIVRYAVENIMNKQFHNMEWKKEWNDLMEKSHFVLKLIGRLPNTNQI